MSDFTEADVDRGVAALWAKRYPYSADYVACVLAAVAPAMRDRWEKESSPRWWIADGPLARDGVKVLGPFATQELALTVRSHLEKAEDTDRYWVDCDDEQRSGGEQG
jgi:hypothetical protein